MFHMAEFAPFVRILQHISLPIDYYASSHSDVLEPDIWSFAAVFPFSEQNFNLFYI